jgi:hypothetical protein
MSASVGFIVVSLNVDYSATGKGHLDRAPCRVTLATGEIVLVDEVLSVPGLYDTLSGYTQLSEAEVDAGRDLAETAALVRAELVRMGKVMLVGHGLMRAMRSMQLVRGTHYDSALDLVDFLKTWNRRFGHWNYFALPKIAHVMSLPSPPGNSLERARTLLRVYEQLVVDTLAPARCTAELQRLQYGKLFPAEVATKPEAPTTVCVWAYDESNCFCGQPLLGGKAGAAGRDADADLPPLPPLAPLAPLAHLTRLDAQCPELASAPCVS